MDSPIAIVGVPTALGGHLSGMERHAGRAARRSGLRRPACASGPGSRASSVRDAGDLAIDPGFRPTRIRGPRTGQLICEFLPRERDLVAATLAPVAGRTRGC